MTLLHVFFSVLLQVISEAGFPVELVIEIMETMYELKITPEMSFIMKLLRKLVKLGDQETLSRVCTPRRL